MCAHTNALKTLTGLSIVLSLAICDAQAKSLSSWNISGSNTARIEYYDASGETTISPWQEAGSQLTNEVDLNLWRRVSPWESQRIQLSGVLNDSEYRSPEQGGILERGTFFWEKGDAGIPFRLQAGDYYAGQTPATIQLGLKGLQAEIQPTVGQSIQFFSGLPAANYRDLGSDKGVYSGLSWLRETEILGAVSLTAVHYDRDANVNQIDLTQDVYSLAWYIYLIRRNEKPS